MRAGFRRQGTLRATISIVAIVACAGCSQQTGERSREPVFPSGFAVAVAPVLNFSGRFELDPIQAADLLASELAQRQEVTVLPVNRVVAELAAEGKTQVESPDHALRVAEAVGADAIIVAGITEYDAYTPVVGLAMQMYALPRTRLPTLDAVATARQAEPLPASSPGGSNRPVGQVQRVYDAAHKDVLKALRRYAEPRYDTGNPYGWRQYVQVQTLYLRFCWHDALDRLFEQQRRRLETDATGEAALAADLGTESPE